MPPGNSRRLVIDASVARSSGDENATYPTSKRCRDFLLATRETGHQAVMTPGIRDEWNKHQSGFARRWRVSMLARKKLCIANVARNDELREKIERTAAKEKHRKAMLKDMHLIEAAMATDRVIISLDETVRALFSEAARGVSELRIVLWANPDKTEEGCLVWLEAGAKAETRRYLGFVE
jgi:hypothetical protein